MPKFKNRIAILRSAKGWNQDDLAEAIGAHRVTVSKLERGDMQLTPKWMDRMASVLGCEPTDLLTSGSEGETVTVRGTVQAGAWKDHTEWPVEDRYTIQIPILLEWQGYPKAASEVKGNSMNELYPDGSIVVWVPMISLNGMTKSGQKLIIERNRHGEYEVTLKELLVGQDGKTWLIPRTTDPSQKAPIPASGSDGETIRAIGRVIWGGRKEEP